MEAIPYLALISAVAALGLAAYYYKLVEAAPAGNDRMVFLMNEIQKGARAFLKAEYTWVAGFVVAMMILLAIVIDPLAPIAYLLGAVLSAGFLPNRALVFRPDDPLPALADAVHVVRRLLLGS